MSTTNDLFEEWKGEVQRLTRDSVASKQSEARMSRRASRSAQDALDAQEAQSKAQERVQTLYGALGSAREKLEKMHVPGCLRIGFDCPACEAIEDLDSY